MSKVLLINGSSRQEGNTAVALAEVAGALEGHGIECISDEPIEMIALILYE